MDAKTMKRTQATYKQKIRKPTGRARVFPLEEK